MRTYVIRVTSGDRTGWYHWDWFTGESWIVLGGDLCAFTRDGTGGFIRPSQFTTPTAARRMLPDVRRTARASGFAYATAPLKVELFAINPVAWTLLNRHPLRPRKRHRRRNQKPRR